MNPCRICENPRKAEIEKLVATSTYKAVMEAFPEIGQTSIQSHKKHMAVPQELSEAELDAAPRPDVVGIVEREVNRYSLLQKKRKLNQSEQFLLAKYIDFLMKITMAKLEKQQTERHDTRWIDDLIAKIEAEDRDGKQPKETIAGTT